MAKPKKYRLTITAVVSVEEIKPRKDQTRRRKPKAEKQQRAR